MWCPLGDRVNPNVHHILFKTGGVEAQQALVKEGQELLRKYGIDPIVGAENLTWAPNRVSGQHNLTRLQHVVDKLKEVDGFGGTREKMVDMLKRLGKEAARIE